MYHSFDERAAPRQQTDTYRRVVHCTFGSGSEVAAPATDDREEWLEYLLRDGLRTPLPKGVNQNYAEQPHRT